MLMRAFIPLVAVFLFCNLSAPCFAGASFPSFDETQMSGIREIVEKEIRDGRIPGAVVLVGSRDKVMYREAFGYRSLIPEKDLMTEDSVFDLSSLTKVVATTTAVMQLVEKGKLLLDKPVVYYWPEFRRNGKAGITVRQLLTHYSGLRADLDMRRKWSGGREALKRIIAEKTVSLPGSQFLYSDINFIILGELVQRVSGLPLDVYCAKHIFRPLGMKDTSFLPDSSVRGRIAPTEYVDSEERILHGEVHDPTARRMGGVAGHAGLFSSADDLSVFVRMLLDHGREGDSTILSPLSVKKMTTPQSPPGKTILRGLGWDIKSPFSSCRGTLFPVGSFGHTGFTGTSLWIDPASETYVIILTSRLHPDGRGDAKILRSEIANSIAASIGYGAKKPVLEASSGFSQQGEVRSDYREGLAIKKVETGIDALEAEMFRPLSGLRIGLITNHSGLDSAGRRTLDVLFRAPGVELKAVFNPEHGLSGREDRKVPSTVDSATGIPVYSLYGEVKRPTDKMLEGLDALVFDIQDAGARFYTYISTMGYAMEAAAMKGIAFYVLDRPNPISASIVQGFLPDNDMRSFTAYFPLPVRHGMTVGELAAMFNTENRMGLKLEVIRLRGYERSDWYDETGLSWTNPSPNIRSVDEAALYPGVALLEGANVSVGRGTDAPFELLGAPWIDGEELAAYLDKRAIKGVRIVPAHFTPSDSIYKNVRCHGVQIVLLDRRALNAPVLGIEIISALHKLYQKKFQLEKTLSLVAARRVLDAIRNGHDPSLIATQWQERLSEFRKTREKYLLY